MNALNEMFYCLKIERDTANANFSLLIEFMVAQVKLKYYVTHSTVFIFVCRLTVWGDRKSVV